MLGPEVPGYPLQRLPWHGCWITNEETGSSECDIQMYPLPSHTQPKEKNLRLMIVGQLLSEELDSFVGRACCHFLVLLLSLSKLEG